METHIFPLGRFVAVSSCGRYTAYSEVVDLLDYSHRINVVDHHTEIVSFSETISMLKSIQFLDTRLGVRLCIINNIDGVGLYTTDCLAIASLSGSSCTSLNGCIVKLDKGVVTNRTDTRVLDLIPSRACELAVYRTVQNSQPLVFTTGRDLRFAEPYRGDKIRSLPNLGQRVVDIYVGDTIIACGVLTEEKRRRQTPEEVVILNKRNLKVIKTVPGVLLDVVHDLVFVRHVLSSFVHIPGTMVVTSDGCEFSIKHTVVAISSTRVVLSQDSQGVSIPLKVVYDHEQSAYVLRPLDLVITKSPHALEKYLPPELVAMCL